MKKKKGSAVKRSTRLSSGRVRWGIVVTILLLTIPFTILVSREQQDTRQFAQVGVTPQFGCIGCPPVPSSADQMPISPAPQQNGQIIPGPSNAILNNPNAPEEPCNETASIADHRDDNRRGGNDNGGSGGLDGIIEQLIELIRKLIELLGGGGNITPPGNQAPEAPNENGQENPGQPQQNEEEADPCPPADEQQEETDKNKDKKNKDEQKDDKQNDAQPDEAQPDQEQEEPDAANPSAAPAPSSAAPAPACTGTTCAFQALVAGSKLISKWGDPRSGGRTHEGVDLGQTKGTACKAIENGVITTITATNTGLGGITLSMKDDKGRKMYYAHLQEPPTVKVGERVTRGQTFCKIDNTGNAATTPSHLHYQISTPNGDWADPEVVLKDWPN